MTYIGGVKEKKDDRLAIRKSKKLLEYNILAQKISGYSDISIFKVVAISAQASYLNNDIRICRNLKLLHLNF